jgi:hypothetical protein
MLTSRPVQAPERRGSQAGDIVATATASFSGWVGRIAHFFETPDHRLYDLYIRREG